MSFAHNLQQLPSVENVSFLQLFDDSGGHQGVIENQAGQAGSLAVYAFLAGKYGRIDRVAAQEGLSLFAEHTDHARANPGSHPNIDRLLACVEDDLCWRVQISHKSRT